MTLHTFQLLYLAAAALSSGGRLGDITSHLLISRDTMDLTIDYIVSHLSKYGYISEEDVFEGGLGKVPEPIVMKFQEFHGIEATGEFDEATSEVMQLPRCCHRDVIKREITREPSQLCDKSPEEKEEPKRRTANLTLWKTPTVDKWKKSTITWRVTQYSQCASKDMPKNLVDEALRRAFYVWEKHANITFKFEPNDNILPDIEIRWEVGDHGDGDPFDGKGGTLAHAFFPQGDRLSGDLHFDDQETWTLGTARVGVNLTQAAAHEIGHSLGLDHSRDSTALMAPVYRGYKEQFDLMPDDIEKIQALYGKSTRTPDPVPSEEVWVPGKTSHPSGSGGDSGASGGSGPSSGTIPSGRETPFLPECPCPCSLL